MRILLLYLFFFVAMLALFGCTQQTAYTPVPLSWEVKPAGKIWSAECYKRAGEVFADLDKAKDIASFHEKYSSGSKDQKINIWCELFSALAKYESSWDPRSSSVDVGDREKRNTYSIGLLQGSVVDQANYKLGTSYTYEQFLEGPPAIHVGVLTMARQIRLCGSVVLPNASSCRNWAVLLEGNKYQKIEFIRAMVRRLPL